MITLKERMIIATVTSAVAFVIFGMVMIGTGINLYPAMLGFVIGAYGFQILMHTLGVRKHNRLHARHD